MIKIGAKLILNHKTIKSYEYININEYNSKNFYSIISTICQKLDIETPVIIDYHRKCYEDFNSLKFTADDFIDKIKFDYLYIENDDR